MARMVVPAREGWFRISKWVRIVQTRRCFCTTNNSNPMNRNNNNNNSNSNDGSFRDLEAYRDLDKLDFKRAAKILFTYPPPKNKKFGIDFHLVQLFFACMPSLAVYLVAQYARYEIRRMEAELELKKKAEAEKAKVMELIAAEEKETESDSKLLEVKVRLDKLEETVQEIAVHSKKQSVRSTTDENQGDGADTKHIVASEPNNSQHRSQASNPAPEDNLNQQNSAEVTPGSGQEKANVLDEVADASQQDKNGKAQDRGHSQDSER